MLKFTENMKFDLQLMSVVCALLVPDCALRTFVRAEFVAVIRHDTLKYGVPPGALILSKFVFRNSISVNHLCFICDGLGFKKSFMGKLVFYVSSGD